MFKRFLNTFAILTVLFLLIGSSAAYAERLPINFTPHFGASTPLGDQADKWQTGWTISFDGEWERPSNLTFGGQISFHRWLPNFEELLNLDSDEIRVEREDGWRSMIGLNGFARYYFPKVRSDNFSISIDGGLGLQYIESARVDVRGFYDVGETAVNSFYTQEPKSEFAPDAMARLNFLLLKRISPSIQYQHTFTSDESLSAVIFSLGLLAN